MIPFLSFIFQYRNKRNREISRYIRKIFGFIPRNIDTYKTALIHRSSSVKSTVCGRLNNERLEYLGDAILGAIVADFLFKKFPLFEEGALTQVRSKIVCRDRLNALACKIGLHKMVIINDHIQTKCAYGNAFEALMGAIYLDQGYVKTKQIFMQKIVFTYLDVESLLVEESNYKSKILTWAQKTHKKAEFSHQKSGYHPHNSLFKATLHINNQLMGEGVDYTIKKAEQLAAEKAWEKISGEE